MQALARNSNLQWHTNVDYTKSEEAARNSNLQWHTNWITPGAKTECLGYAVAFCTRLGYTPGLFHLLISRQ